MEAPGSISTRGSLLSFADVTGEIKRPLMYASSCPARCLLSRRLYLQDFRKKASSADDLEVGRGEN